ncbi:complement resistance protein TraT [Ferrovibrio sp.]|uniref:complement resistance protein TraT n=1 Tax=Ferrovibrio sp. TaxID=1917215 RepID=UPI0025C2E623|nr:complement resistance protein TraT [Ferrovibrio sp.]MBX3453212.1 hypothetical protein [Ferrovibrio sp.]
MNLQKFFGRSALIGVGLLLASCIGAAPSRMGMVKDPDTGLQFGSVVERSIVTDPSFMNNRRVKLRLRNTSGDTAFDLRGFSDQIKQSFASAGYQPVEDDNFGVLVDVNVTYSGQIQRNLSTEYAFLGASAGGIAGYRSQTSAGTAMGIVGGATLGSIIGSFVTDDTYIIVSQVTIGFVRQPLGRDGRTVVFGRSAQGNADEEEEREQRRRQTQLRSSTGTGVSVFAGGRNVRQSEIAGEVRQRIARIIGDII